MGFIRVNGKEIENIVFPGGEVHVKDVPLEPMNTDGDFIVEACIQNSEDFMRLALVTDVIMQSGECRNSFLYLPYIPYARQDRRSSQDEALSIRIFAEFINLLKYDSVCIHDPHSDVVGALINNVEIIPQEQILYRIFTEDHWSGGAKPLYLIAPDQGAYKKVWKSAEMLSPDGVIVANKHRDTRTGKITGTSVVLPIGDEDFQSYQFLIVDDLIDGGKTFEELGKQMVMLGAKKENIHLYVTHGIFSKGTAHLLPYFGTIYTTNSFRQLFPQVHNLPVHVLNVWETF